MPTEHAKYPAPNNKVVRRVFVLLSLGPIHANGGYHIFGEVEKPRKLQRQIDLLADSLRRDFVCAASNSVKNALNRPEKWKILDAV